mmetsp:Transcript_14299/g.23519  ORF Transcript_14299/g.23519 Transcript_14299/m.23519 type:complete len:208 (+) Transcript_14299:545-1168(+)
MRVILSTDTKRSAARPALKPTSLPLKESTVSLAKDTVDFTSKVALVIFMSVTATPARFLANEALRASLVLASNRLTFMAYFTLTMGDLGAGALVSTLSTPAMISPALRGSLVMTLGATPWVARDAAICFLVSTMILGSQENDVVLSNVPRNEKYVHLSVSKPISRNVLALNAGVYQPMAPQSMLCWEAVALAEQPLGCTVASHVVPV